MRDMIIRQTGMIWVSYTLYIHGYGAQTWIGAPFISCCKRAICHTGMIGGSVIIHELPIGARYTVVMGLHYARIGAPYASAIVA